MLSLSVRDGNMGLVRIEDQATVDFVGTEREVMAFAHAGDRLQFVARKYAADRIVRIAEQQ